MQSPFEMSDVGIRSLTPPGQTILRQRLSFGHDALHDVAGGRDVVDQPGVLSDE